MLLMTFGLEAMVGLLHPRDWVDGLLAEEAERQHDFARRDMWWGRAHDVAKILREQFNISTIAVIGDLRRETPLSYWSELSIVVPELPRDRYELYTALGALPKDPPINLLSAANTSPRQQAELERVVWL